MIRAIWSSVAVFALAPMQDFLNLGSEARMNFPGRPSGNWSWRMDKDALDEHLHNRLKDYNYVYGRTPKLGAPEEVTDESIEYQPAEPLPKMVKAEKQT